jgi:hypothetical protein
MYIKLQRLLAVQLETFPTSNFKNDTDLPVSGFHFLMSVHHVLLTGNSNSSTGATGYIGGEVLHALQHAHPDYEVAALIRDKEKASKVLGAFPKVRVVLADLDNVDIIEEESRKANIVIRESIYVQ